MTHRYQQSEALLNQALKTIPLGSQTFSKSKTQYVVGSSPFFIEKAKGAQVWDVDGNVYLDFVNALACVTLGYADESTNQAVTQQLTQGVSFSLPHPLEMQVAEMLVEMIPSAQMVRFGKNGTDATSAAIRLARAYTGKERIAVCGYHGWQDWYIGSTAKNLGVPQCVQELTHRFEYNNINSLLDLLEQYEGEFAAVMMEPMNSVYPEPGFLEQIRELTQQKGIVLIFDETITGFRFAKGGAQELFGVTPDLSTFGKGLANGHPLSAVVGRQHIMMKMEDIFFSGTFGGETLSLAAAKAVLNTLQNEPVIEHLAQLGSALREQINHLIETYQLGEVLHLSGHPSWLFLTIKDQAEVTSWQIKTFIQQELLKRGILMIGTHNLSYAHTQKDINQLCQVYDEVFAVLKQELSQNSLLHLLEGDVLQPLFKVR